MSDTRWERLQDLFHRAIQLDPEARARLIDRECGDDGALRGELERLLGANDRAGGFIRAPVLVLPGEPEPELPAEGRPIGAYRLVKAIGRGGMGTVYLAERDDGAFRQRVAIKLIKRGMDTDQVRPKVQKLSAWWPDSPPATAMRNCSGDAHSGTAPFST